jgi:hypothetical protein
MTRMAHGAHTFKLWPTSTLPYASNSVRNPISPAPQAHRANTPSVTTPLPLQGRSGEVRAFPGHFNISNAYPPSPAPHNQQGARGQHRRHPNRPPHLRALPRRGTPRRVSTEAAVSPGMVFSPSNTLEAARPNRSRFTISWHTQYTPKQRSQARAGRRENGRRELRVHV